MKLQLTRLKVRYNYIRVATAEEARRINTPVIGLKRGDLSKEYVLINAYLETLPNPISEVEIILLTSSQDQRSTDYAILVSDLPKPPYLAIDDSKAPHALVTLASMVTGLSPYPNTEERELRKALLPLIYDSDLTYDIGDSK